LNQDELQPVAPPSGTPGTDGATPRVYTRSEHPISRKLISPNALRVLYRLREGGHEAYLVGGCLRDIILGIEPKDFDVATSARPEEVRRLFRNCRLIGRRFRLAHVVYGREIIEVATFRASGSPSQGEEPDDDPDILPEVGAVADAADLPDDEADDTLDAPLNADDAEELPDEYAPPGRGTGDRVHDDSGRILRDNTYGTLDEDVWRRDFTCNGLYYGIDDFSVRDFVGGYQDVLDRRLRLIGDPETRYREDPVRMLRAARFEAKLGFTLAPETEAPIATLSRLLEQVPAARLFDETLKLFLTGHGARSLEVLRRRGLLAVLYPAVDDYLQRHTGSLVEALLVEGLRNTDERVQADKPVTPTFLFALLLYGPIAAYIESQPRERWGDPGTILDGVDHAVRIAQARVTIPRRFALGVKELFALQPRLEQPRGRRALRLIENPRFRAAYDLLLLRARIGMASRAVADWWTQLQEAGNEERDRMADSLDRGSGGGRSEAGGSRGPRRRRRRRGGGPSASAT
jgi:poly(A) polymerase